MYAHAGAVKTRSYQGTKLGNVWQVLSHVKETLGNIFVLLLVTFQLLCPPWLHSASCRQERHKEKQGAK